MNGAGARPAAFALEAVCKSYGQTPALHPTDLAINAGEYLVLLGPSGSGKTTLLMILAGFIRPTGGDVVRDGVRITGVAPEKRGFGVVFQGYALFPHLSVADNVAFPLKVRGVDRAEARGRVTATLEMMKLLPLADRMPRQLSGGQRQRVALARALVFDPPLLLLDEPMSALDKKLKDDLQAELKEIHRRVGTTFVHITHDQDEAMSLADRSAVMCDGRIIQLGTPKQLYEKPASRFVANFLGKSNFITGTLAGRMGPVLRFSVAGQSLQQLAPQPAEGDPAQVTVAIRPEHMSIGPLTGDRGGNAVRGTVQSVLFFGTSYEVRVGVPSVGTMLIHLGGRDVPPEPGAEVRVCWPPECGIVLVG